MRLDEISHFSHPHDLIRFEHGRFRCDGCKELGTGPHYSCSICNYHLHQHCTHLSDKFTHPFYKKCTFKFMSAPPGGDKARYCNACRMDVKGFVYHYKAKQFDLDLHPCCAKLPAVLNDGGMKLNLCKKVRSKCNCCGEEGESWSYRSECKNYNVHVGCARNRLEENWDQLSRRDIPSLETIMYAPNNRRGIKWKVVKKCIKIVGPVVLRVIFALLGA